MANPKITHLPLSEKQVTAQVKQFLEAKGWVYFRLQAGLLKTKDSRFMRVGQKGMPDAIAVRGAVRNGYSQTIMLEFKSSSGGKLSADQVMFHKDLRRKNLAVLVISGFEEFLKMYYELFGELG